ncbi:hypothetical protein LMTR13_07800 [Bradyrhizobium icense]|uniref:Uncharacterized protein n=1 Tax=Bradyrhizobium icense TaxID=1274631 RepID=A0A1B1UBI3_9BRAD|nr:hypothetical protein LMTR13_07800 [Bradyrhizobium icense]
MFFGSWAIHYFALLFVVFGVGILNAGLHKHVLGTPKDADFSDPELPYQVTVTVLVIALSVMALRYWPASDI